MPKYKLLEEANKKKAKKDVLLAPKTKKDSYDDNDELIIDKKRFDRVKKAYDNMPILIQKQGIRTREDLETVVGNLDGYEFFGDIPAKKSKEKNGMLGYGKWQAVKNNKKINESKEFLNEATNSDIIKMFLDNSFPKDRKDIFGIDNVKIKKEINELYGGSSYGWSLYNYQTVILYRDDIDPDTVYFNTEYYSRTTSKIQSYIRQYIAIKGLKVIEINESEMQKQMDIGYDRVAQDEEIDIDQFHENKSIKDVKSKLQNIYESLEEFEAFDHLYQLTEKLGYKTSQEAWNKNPRVLVSIQLNENNILKESIKKIKEISSVGGIAGYNAPLQLAPQRIGRFNKLFKNHNKMNKRGMHYKVSKRDVKNYGIDPSGKEYTDSVTHGKQK